MNRLLNCGSRFVTNVHDYTGTQAMKDLGIINRHIYRNLKVPEYYEVGFFREPANPLTKQSVISETGALCAYSAYATGRHPK